MFSAQVKDSHHITTLTIFTVCLWSLRLLSVGLGLCKSRGQPSAVPSMVHGCILLLGGVLGVKIYTPTNTHTKVMWKYFGRGRKINQTKAATNGIVCVRNGGAGGCNPNHTEPCVASFRISVVHAASFTFWSLSGAGGGGDSSGRVISAVPGAAATAGWV